MMRIHMMSKMLASIALACSSFVSLWAQDQTTINYPVTYTNTFKPIAGSTGAASEWRVIGNWQTGTLTSVSSPTEPLTGSIPGVSNGNLAPFVIDGAVIGDSIMTVGDYKTVHTHVFNGYLTYGAFNGVHLKIVALLNKPGISSPRWDVDETSKMTLMNAIPYQEEILTLHVKSEKGVVFSKSPTATATGTLNLNLYQQGSIQYDADLTVACNYVVKSLILNCMGRGDEKEKVSRKLIGFASENGTATFSVETMGVTNYQSGVTLTKKADGDVTIEDAVGFYSFREANDGYYVDYVTRDGIVIHSATINSEAVNWDDVSFVPEWYNDGSGRAKITTSGTTSLSFDRTDGAVKAQLISFIGTGDLTLTGDVPLPIIGTMDFLKMMGTSTIGFSTDKTTIRAGAHTILSETGTGSLEIAVGKQISLGNSWNDAISLGGTLNAKENATLSGAISVTGDFTFSADVGKTLTINSTWPTTSLMPTLTTGGQGTIKLTKSLTRKGGTTVKSGILDITTPEVNLYESDFDSTIVVEKDATLKLHNLDTSLNNRMELSNCTVKGSLSVTGGVNNAIRPVTLEGGSFRYNPTEGGSQTLTFTGGLKLTGDCEIGGTGNINMTEVNKLSGNGTLFKVGANTLTITADQSYNGQMHIEEGKLVIETEKVFNGGYMTINGGEVIASKWNVDPPVTVGARGGTLTINSEERVSFGPFYNVGGTTLTLNRQVSPADIANGKVTLAIIFPDTLAEQFTVNLTNSVTGSPIANVTHQIDEASSTLVATFAQNNTELFFTPITSKPSMTWNTTSMDWDSDKGPFVDFNSVSFMTGENVNSSIITIDGSPIALNMTIGNNFNFNATNANELTVAETLTKEDVGLSTLNLPTSVKRLDVQAGTLTFTKSISATRVNVGVGASLFVEDNLNAQDITIQKGATFEAETIGIGTEMSSKKITLEDGAILMATGVYHATITTGKDCIFKVGSGNKSLNINGGLKLDTAFDKITVDCSALEPSAGVYPFLQITGAEQRDFGVGDFNIINAPKGFKAEITEDAGHYKILLIRLFILNGTPITWSDLCGDYHPLPTDIITLELQADTTLTMDRATTIQKLIVKGADSVGTYTLTIDGNEKLTATDNDASQTSIETSCNIIASNTTLVWTRLNISKDRTVTWAVEDSTELPLPLTLPSVTGEGTFCKRGLGDLVLSRDQSYTVAEICSQEGAIMLTEGDYNQSLRFVAKDGGGIELTSTGTSTPESSTIILTLGEAGYLGVDYSTVNATINAQINVEASAKTPAEIRVLSTSQSGAALAGEISGDGTLKVLSATNPYTISSIIQDGAGVDRLVLEVVLNSDVTLSNVNNSYIGGTIISQTTDMALIINDSQSLGKGSVSGNGNLKISPGNAMLIATQAKFTNERWKGTLLFEEAGENIKLSDLGNAQSTIKFNTSDTTTISLLGNTTPEIIPVNVDIDTFWNIQNNGPSESHYTITGKLTGEGNIWFKELKDDDDVQISGTIQFKGTASAFKGGVKLEGLRGIIFGDSKRQDLEMADIIVGNAMTIATGKTWSAKRLIVNGSLALFNNVGIQPGNVLGGTGTITCHDRKTMMFTNRDVLLQDSLTIDSARVFGSDATIKLIYKDAPTTIKAFTLPTKTLTIDTTGSILPVGGGPILKWDTMPASAETKIKFTQAVTVEQYFDIRNDGIWWIDNTAKVTITGDVSTEVNTYIQSIATEVTTITADKANLIYLFSLVKIPTGSIGLGITGFVLDTPATAQIVTQVFLDAADLETLDADGATLNGSITLWGATTLDAASFTKIDNASSPTTIDKNGTATITVNLTEIPFVKAVAALPPPSTP